MAVYIDIIKVEERDDWVDYDYTTNRHKGKLSINIKTLAIKELIPYSGVNKEAMVAYVTHKLKKAIKEGDVPEKTYWAS